MQWALTRYVLAATLARGADAGAAVGIVLLAASHAHGGARAGGLLAVGLTAPHLLGPLLARRLDRARDARNALCGACAVYAGALAAAALVLGRAPLVVVAGAVAVAGACGPLLTGGLSSRLAGLAAPGETAQRRAQGWDAVSYGVGGTAGPAAVAALAGLVGPLTALLTLTGAAACAAGLTLTLPRTEARAASARAALPVRAVLRLIAGHGPLRRVAVATTVTSLSLGAVPAVIAVVLGSALHAGPGAGAALAAAFGLGNLAGSLALTALPLRGEPELLTIRGAAAMAGALSLCALAPSYSLALAAFALAGAVNAPFFTATLAARSGYSPAAARAQVFVSMAAAKVAAAAAGSALAAAAIGSGARTLLAAGAALTLAAAVLCAADRRLAAPGRGASRTPRRRPAPVPHGCRH